MYTGGVTLPAFYFLVDRFASGKVIQAGGEAMNYFPLQAVCSTDFNSREGIEYIKFGDDSGIQSVQLRDKTSRYSVEPTAAALPTCIRAKFVTPIAHLLSSVIEKFSGHGTTAYASDIGLVDANNPINRARWQTCAASSVG